MSTSVSPLPPPAAPVPVWSPPRPWPPFYCRLKRHRGAMKWNMTSGRKRRLMHGGNRTALMLSGIGRVGIT
jgi:hypothetical protein